LQELGGTIALKLSAAGVQHKSELGGVALGLESASEVCLAYRRLAALAAEHGGAVLAERMLPAGVELLVAAHTRGIVPALVVGLGGIWTELVDDVRVIPLPARPDRVEQALHSLRMRIPIDATAAASLAARVGELLLEESLELIELNPILVGPTGAVAVDAVVCPRAGARTMV